jgi:hypothetical protein
MEIDPSFQRPRHFAEQVYLLQHKIPELLALIDGSERTDAEKAEIHRVIARDGEVGYRQWMLRRVLNDPLRRQRAMNLASAYGLAEDRDHALQYLKQARAEGDPRVTYVRAYPHFWFLYGDPEFNDLLKKAGLPETTK